jgi:hypothetical protein
VTKKRTNCHGCILFFFHLLIPNRIKNADNNTLNAIICGSAFKEIESPPIFARQKLKCIQEPIANNNISTHVLQKNGIKKSIISKVGI